MSTRRGAASSPTIACLGSLLHVGAWEMWALHVDVCPTCMAPAALPASGQSLDAQSQAAVDTGAAIKAFPEPPRAQTWCGSQAGEEVPVAELPVGATVLVRPGERIPADGRVTLGVSVTDESMLTGAEAKR